MQETKSSFLKLKKKYLNFIKKQENFGPSFYGKLRQLKRFYLPMSNLIYKSYIEKKKPIIIGLSGGQGSGKSTIAQILKIILESKFKLNIVYFSIDDFYKTFKQRKKMSKKIHKLFLTRGVPGTHDTSLLKDVLKSLLKKNFKPFLIPLFDKSNDDRYPKKNWKRIIKKPDIIIFEGWCVSAKYQAKSLRKPINKLEKEHDKDLIWRKKVNNELKNKYNKIFRLIDKNIFLKVPNFSYVYKWRILQEKRLKFLSKGKKIMTENEVKKFVMHYERVTRDMIRDFKISADVVIGIDKKHRFYKIKMS